MDLLGEVLLHFQVTEFGVVGEESVRVTRLTHDLRRDSPVVRQIDLERRATTLGLDIVVILLYLRGIVLRESRRPALRNIGHGPGYVVDESRILLIPTHQAHGRDGGDGHIHESLDRVALPAVVYRVTFDVIAGLEAGRVGLVSDDANRARLGACAVQRA